MIDGKSIYCDCCGREKLAEIKDGNLVIKDSRHGEKHVVIINCSELLDILENNGYSLSNIKTSVTT
jgi:hypothetical protein